MNWSAKYLKFALIIACGAMLTTTDDLSHFEMASSKPPMKKKMASSLPLKKATVNPKAKLSKEQEEALAQKTVTQVEKIYKLTELVSPDLNLGSNTHAGCENCSAAAAVSELKFNQCSETDNYLESALEAKSKSKSYMGALIRSPISQKPIIHPACIDLAMNLQSAKSGPVVNYKLCSNGNATNAQARPCLSENYVTLVNNSFEVVSQCMKGYIGEGESARAQKENILEVFGMLAVESGFHINITSKTGAGGIGQFTGDAINAVNKVVGETSDYLSNHSDQRCQKLASEFLGEKNLMKSEGTCERVSIKEGNPVTNLLYTYAALKEAKDYFDDNVFNDPKLSAKFALSANEMAKLKRATMVWSHNTGFAGLKTPLTKLLTTKYAKKKVTNTDVFLSELKTYAISYPNKGNAGSKARIKETANYYAKIQAKIGVVEFGRGKSCLN